MTATRNILLVITDQQHLRTLQAYGCSEARTPHLDRLAENGLRFDGLHATNPVCMPARASMFTGRYINEHGVWQNGCRLRPDHPTIATAFNGAGWQTAHIGKLHLQPILNRVDEVHDYGFRHCEIAEGDQQLTHDEYFKWLRRKDPDLFFDYIVQCYESGHANGYCSKMTEDCHLSTWTAARACEWLRHSRRAEAPFLLSVGFFDPHHAFNPCEPWYSRFAEAEVADPVWHPDSAATRPGHIRQRIEGMNKLCRDLPRMRNTRRAYHAMVAHVDDCIGRMLSCLAELGLAENTEVVFTADHGEMLGNHGLLWKGPFLWDDLLRVPLIVARADGGGPRGQPTGLVSGVDLWPSLLALAGAPDTGGHAGRTFIGNDGRPFPEGRRAHVLAEWEPGSGPETPRLRSLRSDDARYVWSPDPTAREYYDLTADPQGFYNRIDDPACAPAIAHCEESLHSCYPHLRHPNPQECKV